MAALSQAWLRVALAFWCPSPKDKQGLVEQVRKQLKGHMRLRSPGHRATGGLCSDPVQHLWSNPLCSERTSHFRLPQTDLFSRTQMEQAPNSLALASKRLSVSNRAAFTFQLNRSPRMRIRGPVMLTTDGLRASADVKRITKPKALAASSFCSGLPVRTPSRNTGRMEVTPWQENQN